MPIHNFFRNAALLAALAALPAGTTMAQSPVDGDVPDDYYRAELVILERLVDPSDVEERMADKQVAPPVSSRTNLWVEGENGSRASDLKLVSPGDMHLGQSAERLENSGRYRVLATAGWYQGFPPEEDTGPMRVALGEWLAAAGHREIEGTIRIERRRYLHVDVDLNHWQITDDALEQARRKAEAAAAARQEDTGKESLEAGSGLAEASPEAGGDQPAPVVLPKADPELITWIRETRRMRSGEIHFIDSPTIGVLVYFEPIEND